MAVFRGLVRLSSSVRHGSRHEETDKSDGRRTTLDSSVSLGRRSSLRLSSRWALSSVKRKYVVGKELGRGSFGIVRTCQDRTTKKRYACKTIAISRVPSFDLLEEEVRNLQRVTTFHPNILGFMEVFEDFKDIHIITEKCEGGELYDHILRRARTPRRKFSEKDTAWMVRNILDAISHLHEVYHVCHRDLKASNFLFATADTDGNVDPMDIKIIDFGLSCYVPPVVVDGRTTLGKMTGCVGTPYYTAPEVVTKEFYTNKCDVWSIGVLAYLLLSVSLPFQGKDERETVQLLVSESIVVQYAPSKWADVSQSAKEFVMSLLQKDPSVRPSAREAMRHPWIVQYCGEPGPLPPAAQVDCDEEDNGYEQAMDARSIFLMKSTGLTDSTTAPPRVESLSIRTDGSMTIAESSTAGDDSSETFLHSKVRPKGLPDCSDGTGTSRQHALTSVSEQSEKTNLMKWLFRRS